MSFLEMSSAGSSMITSVVVNIETPQAVSRAAIVPVLFERLVLSRQSLATDIRADQSCRLKAAYTEVAPFKWFLVVTTHPPTRPAGGLAWLCGIAVSTQ